MAGVPRRPARPDGIDAVAISAATGEGLDALRAALADLLPDAAELAEPPEPAGVVVHRIEAMGDGFARRADEDGAFRVRGKRIERIAAQTNFDDRGIGRAVPARPRAARASTPSCAGPGSRPGDTVRIGATELEWEAQPWERTVTAARPRRGRAAARVGIFGGTFDPIHVAHLAVAEEAAEALGLERVLFVPAGAAAAQAGPARSAPAQDRLAMVELAIAGNDRLRGEPDRDRPRRAVVHGRHARRRCSTRPRRPAASRT